MTRYQERQLRGWLEYVVETALDMLDQLDAVAEDREPEDEDDMVAA